MDYLLEVDDLQISFSTYLGIIHAVRGLSFKLRAGEILGIVGESGCGKTVAAQSLVRLLQTPPAQVKSKGIHFNGKDILACSSAEMENIRGKEIGMIFQDPMTSLNPTMCIGKQIMEPLIKHQKLTYHEARKQTIELLELVGISQADKRIDQYPHEFSGGMRQRVMIAIALSCKPKLLIADEPTTALDVTIQAQILDLMKNLRTQMNMSIILITHNLGIVANMCQRVLVMYAGKIIEEGDVDSIFYNPQHPYTRGLLESLPHSGHALVPIPGSPPDLLHSQETCAFHPRCKEAMNICSMRSPQLLEVAPQHKAACWLHHSRATKGIV